MLVFIYHYVTFCIILQLKHISDLIQNSDKESLAGLNTLKGKLVELVALTKENISSLQSTTSSRNDNTDSIDDEFALFMVMLCIHFFKTLRVVLISTCRLFS